MNPPKPHFIRQPPSPLVHLPGADFFCARTGFGAWGPCSRLGFPLLEFQAGALLKRRPPKSGGETKTGESIRLAAAPPAHFPTKAQIQSSGSFMKRRPKKPRVDYLGITKGRSLNHAAGDGPEASKDSTTKNRFFFPEPGSGRDLIESRPFPVSAPATGQKRAGLGLSGKSFPKLAQHVG